jgi:hypothetical protein
MPFWSRTPKPPAPSVPTFVESDMTLSDLEVRAGVAFTSQDWSEAERCYRDIIAQDDHDLVMVARDVLGTVLEETKRTDEAILLYEANACDGSPNSHSYLRLAIIYRNRGQTEDEMRVLERGIAVLRQTHGVGAGADLMLRLVKLQTQR